LISGQINDHEKKKKACKGKLDELVSLV